ncbi:MAG: hypothetical protein O3B21_12920, partial [Proteobacteria bacterium]|nr:hypothetical protein [Pseudomonadota bacterium]
LKQQRQAFDAVMRNREKIRKQEIRERSARLERERREQEAREQEAREQKLLKIRTQPKSLSSAEKTALSTPFSVSLVPQMNDLMLCVQGQFRNNITLTAEISKRGIRCNKLLELMR